MTIGSLQEYIAVLKEIASKTAIRMSQGTPVVTLADVNDSWAALACAEREFVLEKQSISPNAQNTQSVKILPHAEKAFQEAGIVWTHIVSGITEKKIGHCSIRTFTIPLY